MRVRVFVDFWNLQLAWNSWHATRGKKTRVRIPWKTALPESEFLCKTGTRFKLYHYPDDRS